MAADEQRRAELRQRFIEHGIHPADLEEAVAIELGESDGCTVVREWPDRASDEAILLGGPPRPMRLAFYEQGEHLGVVDWADGQLQGKGAFTSIVEHRMQRDCCSVVEALESLDGWSNGYLASRVIPTGRSNQ